MENIFGSDFLEKQVEFHKSITTSMENCECTKYLKKYEIHESELSSSLLLKTFFVLICNLQNDNTDKLLIEFSVGKKISFGRHYVRYTLYLKGTFNKELFIQIPYNELTYGDGSIFTLLNFHEELNGLDYELSKQKDELVKQSYADFVKKHKH
jgi:hypothetical protein